MEEDFLEKYKNELLRKKDLEKLKYIEGLHKKILPSQLKRIHEKDKSVMHELFLPKWFTWELLSVWAEKYAAPSKGKTCALCSGKSQLGVDFNEKFVCERCFVKLKQM